MMPPGVGFAPRLNYAFGASHFYVLKAVFQSGFQTRGKKRERAAHVCLKALAAQNTFYGQIKSP